MEFLEVLRSVVVVVHIVGFGILFGAWVVEATGRRRAVPLMDWGLAIAAVAGLALAAPWPAGIEMNYMKLGIKLIILLVIGALIGISRARSRKDKPVPAVMFWLIGILALANVSIAVIW